MQLGLKCVILSLNMRGIREKVKKRSIFTYLKDQHTGFYFLQETFSDTNDETPDTSKGVCILIDPRSQIKVEYS